MRAVSESTPALKKPEIASKPQVKDPPKDTSASKTAEASEEEPRYVNDSSKSAVHAMKGIRSWSLTSTYPQPSVFCSSNQVTIQFQREQAKAMRKYFKNLAYSEEVVKSK